MPAVGADHQVGTDFRLADFGFRPHADDPAALLDEIGRLRLHHQMEAGVAPAAVGEKIEEIPLRHEGDEFAGAGQPGEFRHRDGDIADLADKALDLAMRQAQERLEQSQFLHQVQRRGMDGVAAEIAQEIRVFLQYDHIDAGAGQEVGQHHAGRPAADDATLRGECVCAHVSSNAIEALDVPPARSDDSIIPPRRRRRRGDRGRLPTRRPDGG